MRTGSMECHMRLAWTSAAAGKRGGEARVEWCRGRIWASGWGCSMDSWNWTLGAARLWLSGVDLCHSVTIEIISGVCDGDEASWAPPGGFPGHRRLCLSSCLRICWILNWCCCSCMRRVDAFSGSSSLASASYNGPM